MFKMCKIIKIAFKKQVFRKKKFGSAEFFSLRGGSLSHTLKTPGLEQITSGVIHLYGTPVRASGKLPISQLSCGIGGGTSPFGRRSFPVSHCTHLQHTPAPKRRVKKNTTIISDVGLLAHTSARRHADPLGFTPLFYSLASPLLKKRKCVQ